MQGKAHVQPRSPLKFKVILEKDFSIGNGAPSRYARLGKNEGMRRDHRDA